MNNWNKWKKLFYHDLTAGLINAWWKTFPIVVYILSVCVLFENKLNQQYEAGISSTLLHPTIGDYLVHLFAGMEPYYYNMRNGFRLPAIWTMAFVLFALLIAKYPREDIQGFGQQLLLKSRSRIAWWCAKLSWIISSSVIYYLITVATIAIYSGFHGKIAWLPSPSISSTFTGLFGNARMQTAAVWLILVPILSFIAFGVVELVASIYLSSVAGVLVVLALLLASLYFNNSYLPGSSCILLRSELSLYGGVTAVEAVATLITTIVLFAILGGLLFHVYDVYGNREG